MSASDRLRVSPRSVPREQHKWPRDAADLPRQRPQASPNRYPGRRAEFRPDAAPEPRSLSGWSQRRRCAPDDCGHHRPAGSVESGRLHHRHLDPWEFEGSRAHPGRGRSPTHLPAGGRNLSSESGPTTGGLHRQRWQAQQSNRVPLRAGNQCGYATRSSGQTARRDQPAATSRRPEARCAVSTCAGSG